MLNTCMACSGTGEKFDKDRDEWNDPIETCPKCEGIGMVNANQCPPNECVPNRSGFCINCGYELMREVDDDGIPKLD